MNPRALSREETGRAKPAYREIPSSPATAGRGTMRSMVVGARAMKAKSLIGAIDGRAALSPLATSSTKTGRRINPHQ